MKILRIFIFLIVGAVIIYGLYSAFIAGDDNTRTNVLTGPVRTYQGASYFIDIPIGWQDVPDFSKSEANYSSKWWKFADSVANITWSNTSEPNELVHNDWGSTLDKVKTWPEQFSVTHPNIPGAEQVDLFEQRTGDQFPFYSISMFVRGSGENRYEIRSELVQATPEEIEALRQVVLSFRLTQ